MPKACCLPGPQKKRLPIHHSTPWSHNDNAKGSLQNNLENQSQKKNTGSAPKQLLQIVAHSLGFKMPAKYRGVLRGNDLSVISGVQFDHSPLDYQSKTRALGVTI